ncbi:acetate--CoA ligase family protein [Candidatus Peregrinibacteria bacterium]|nr:acetate--CoA ligase family protein [Candidatus Peregrinibacteria bacterium]
MSLLSPASIAVIGASATPGKVGHDILKNLLEQGYKGTVFPVNPKGGEILGKKACTSVQEIGEAVDLAVIVIPAAAVPGALLECAEKKISNIVIISAGFGEVHIEEGDALQKEVVRIAKEKELKIIGPNCLGILRPSIGMNASFAKELPSAGTVALISQSGALAVAVMDASMDLGIGYSSVISIGNKAVMDECDFLELCVADKDTKVIGLYLESIRDGKRFLATAAKIAGEKSVVLLKAGVSEQGGKAAASHTGALAGSDAAIDAVCAQTGIHRAHDMQEFLDLLEVLSTQPVLRTERIAVITNAGGPGILATDEAEALNLALPALSVRTLEPMKKALPASAGTGNPIDVIGDADAARFEAALKAAGEDENIDGICVLLTPQVMTPCDDIAKAIVAWKKKYGLMPVVTSFMGDKSVQSSRAILQSNGIPSFDTPERAVKMLAALRKRTSSSQLTAHSSSDTSKRKTKAQSILSGYQGLIPEDVIGQLFAHYGIPLPKQKIAQTEEDAARIAQEIGYPVIAKISSPQIIHKTDVGGIRAHLLTERDVRDGFKAIMSNVKEKAPHADIRGVLIQKFLPAGNEFIVGSTRDASFGHLVMVGMGGIYTELLNDTAFRIAPVIAEEGYRMLSDLTAWKVLLGMRGKGQSDIDGLCRVIEALSQMVTDCPEITDIDINPVIVGESDVAIADAKVVIG